VVAVGILRDHPGAGGERFARALELGLADVRAGGRLAHDVTLVEEEAEGLPRGTRASVEAAFARLAARDVVAVVGPAITDNGLVVRDLADTARVPCINWTGGEVTRSAWMFHYQVGSLEEEPAFLARRLADGGLRRVALVNDDSLVGRRYVECFDDAASRHRLDVRRVPAAEVARTGRDDATDAVLYLGLWDAAHDLAIALAAADVRPRVFANSALMYGHARPDWRRAWEGWCYVDAYSERNPVLADVTSRLGAAAGPPVTVGAAYDMGRLVAEGIGARPAPTRESVQAGLERVKALPAALGTPGTTMGFGRWERAALKGGFLVLRAWRGGASVEVA
jgi:ABC-type branched-subunit amino acid transport system substrate-binding protein